MTPLAVGGGNLGFADMMVVVAGLAGAEQGEVDSYGSLELVLSWLRCLVQVPGGEGKAQARFVCVQAPPAFSSKVRRT